MAHTRTQVVPGTGSDHARIMFTAEAPGKQEDRIGVGFSGNAGKIFDEILAHLGLTRDVIWLNNAVRCRPTDTGAKNRAPRPSEIAACRPWLEQDLGRIKPEIMVTLGRTAFFSVTGEVEFAPFRGKLYLSVVPIFPLAHPAYLIYRKSAVNGYRDDLEKLRQLLLARHILLGPALPSRFMA
ncbi:MAG: uracil-DNA glycosylase [Firmicutes bacterium]|nr:uracil-DNA glycosylase [Bacillota bacterium]MCL5971336.1 uracil-DNA glycosylase [Bacillota bacterium]